MPDNDLREVFPILEDSVSGFGVAPTRVQVGASPVGANGMMVLAFQDVSGNLVLPMLNSSGQLPVTSTAVAPTYLLGQDEIGQGTTSGFTVLPGTVLALGNTMSYGNIAMQVSCLRSARAQLIFNDNGTLSVLGDIFVGAGQYTYTMALPNMGIDTGATGPQQLYVQAFNTDKASAIRATVGAIEG
jgi:hypothetical protein